MRLASGHQAHQTTMMVDGTSDYRGHGGWWILESTTNGAMVDTRVSRVWPATSEASVYLSKTHSLHSEQIDQLTTTAVTNWAKRRTCPPSSRVCRRGPDTPPQRSRRSTASSGSRDPQGVPARLPIRTSILLIPSLSINALKTIARGEYSYQTLEGGGNLEAGHQEPQSLWLKSLFVIIV